MRGMKEPVKLLVVAVIAIVFFLIVFSILMFFPDIFKQLGAMKITPQ